MFRILCVDLLDLDGYKITLAQDVRLTESEILIVLGAIKQLKKGIPIQYVIGECEFYGLTFTCDSRALIPRPETEELVDWVLNEHTECKSLMDIGTGSGCIPIVVKKNIPQCAVHAMDISEDALSLAGDNADRHGLEVTFHQEDIHSPKETYPSFDIIASNPPYVLDHEKNQMKANVLEHEPHIALFVPDIDPLSFYRSIMEFSRKHLKEEGWLYFEINESKGKETKLLFDEFHFQNVEIKQDLNGKDRMARGQRK